VLNDFNPSNVIQICDSVNFSQVKAIGSKSCTAVGEKLSSVTTAAYSSPEVAKALLTRGSENELRLVASSQMDVMALGWTVYEIANGMQSYWKNQTQPISSDEDILAALATLTDEAVQENIENTFKDSEFASIRLWLIDALKVDPADRPSAKKMRERHGPFGQRVGEQDDDLRMLKVPKSVLEAHSKLTEEIVVMSEHMNAGFNDLVTALKYVGEQVAQGSKEQADENNNKLAEYFRLFNDINEKQTSILKVLEMRGNFMPHTFLFIPGMKSNAISKPPTFINRIISFSKSALNAATDLLWTESRIIFFCPVTLKQVREKEWGVCLSPPACALQFHSQRHASSVLS
jgi:hypothetical protein